MAHSAPSQSFDQDRPRPFNLVMLGPPAAGKGTQAALIAKEYGCIPVSTGDLMRGLCDDNPLTEEVRKYMAAGQLVPDSIVFQLLQERIALEDCRTNGFLLDGFPRNLKQALMLHDANIEIHGIVHLDVSTPILMERILGRVIDSETGKTYHLTNHPPPPHRRRFMKRRKDDTESVGRKRIAVYEKTVKPLLAHYRRQAKTHIFSFKVHDTRRTTYQLFQAIANKIDGALHGHRRRRRSRL